MSVALNHNKTQKECGMELEHGISDHFQGIFIFWEFYVLCYLDGLDFYPHNSALLDSSAIIKTVHEDL